MLEIAPDKDVQTVVTTFEVTPGTCDDLLDALRETIADHIRHQPGFIATALHVNDARTRVANYSQWRSREDFMTMLRGPDMRERHRKLHDLCRGFEPVMYEVADAIGAD